MPLDELLALACRLAVLLDAVPKLEDGEIAREVVGTVVVGIVGCMGARGCQER